MPVLRGVFWPQILFLSTTLVWQACGSPDEENEDAYGVTSKIYTVSGTSTEISFSEDETNAKYLIIPYVVGDTSTVNGSSGSESIKYTIDTGGAALSITNALPRQAPPRVMDWRTFDLGLRTLWNRFDPSKGMDQGPIFDEMLRHLETAVVDSGPHRLSFFDKNWGPDRDLRAGFAKAVQQRQQSPAKPFSANLKLNATACPDTITMANDYELTTSDIHLKVEETDYCLVLVGSAAVSEPDTEKIKTNIATSLKLYKSVIYSDTMATTSDDYEFKPLIVVAPFDNSTYWDTSNSALQVTGVFLPDPTDLSNSRPSIYMATDQSKVSAETDSSTLTELFHSALAHELQHAVIHYYRTVVNDFDSDSYETAGIDEGLAHYMEDLLGYGEVNFSLYPGAFLTSFADFNDSLLPITGTKATERGAGHTLFYYLVSQKGGVEFSDGQVSGGSGLSFIRSFVSGSSQSVAGLSGAFGTSSWVSGIGNYAAALMFDGDGGYSGSTAQRVSSPVGDVTNTAGDSGKSYGMRFSSYKSTPALSAKLSSFTTQSTTSATYDIDYYQIKPVVLTITDPAKTVTVTFSEAQTNAAVMAIRVQ